MELEEIQELAESLLSERKYSMLRQMLGNLNAADIALLFDEIDKKEIPLLYRLLPKEEAAETFTYMSRDMQKTLINTLTDRELRAVMDDIFLDDTVDMIEEMPANVVARILRNTDEETRKMINQVLNYPKDSAGSLMTIEYVNIKKDMTVGEAISRIRQTAVDKETIYTCYVTEHRKLIGMVSVKDLLMAEDSMQIEDIMETNVIYTDTHEDKEEVAKIFNKYDFMAIPVVDREERLVGIVTFDDAMDVMQEENTEDITKMAAMTPTEDSYFNTSVFSHAKSRIGWLLVLMLSATVSGFIINHYQESFKLYPLLVSFIPMLSGTGGNCGSQSSTLMIRGLSLDEIKFKDIFRVIFKEFRIAILVSIVLAIVNGIRIYIQYGDMQMSLIIALSLVAVVVLSKFIGCTLPLVAEHIHLDPALMAAPLISTIVDICSTLLYFKIATVVLHISV
ncbi:MAG: magnesium transporter [Lachnospiraceae bacterium]|nr:magnesium transporter [Lachnospiraceae bacterium]